MPARTAASFGIDRESPVGGAATSPGPGALRTVGPIRAVVWAILLATLLVGAAPQAAAQPVDPFEGAIRQLRRATSYNRTGQHHRLLLSLRDLRDPAMRPFFQSLVQGEHWSIQFDAILGLAELDSPSVVDPWLLSRLRSEQDRSDAIRVALELRRLGRTEIEKLLAGEDIAAVARVVMLAELRRLGGEPDSAALRRLATNPDPVIATMAALVLAQIGDVAAASGLSSQLAALPAAERDGVVEELALGAERYELDAAIELLAPFVTGSTQGATMQEAIVSMALALDPVRGIELWRRGLGAEPPPGRRARFGLMLLANAVRLRPEDFDPLDRAGDDPLPPAMAAAGRAVAAGKDAAPALIALYDLGHRRSVRWTLVVAEALDVETARTFYLHVIDQLDDPAKRFADRFADAVDAATRLLGRDPEAIRRRLAEAEDDGPKQEAILLGLSNTRLPVAGELAASVRRIGAGRADSVALIVMARHADTLSRSDLAQLGRIGAGGGRVDETLQAQAAWLYLRHSGRLDAALPEILGRPVEP